MNPNIDTIFFDVGNTLRIVLKEQDFINRAEAGLMELIQTSEPHTSSLPSWRSAGPNTANCPSLPCWTLPRANSGHSICCPITSLI